MNEAVRSYVRSVVERFPQTGKDVLELGAFDVNGNVRDLFPDARSYIGTDKREGPNVDMVLDAHIAFTLPQRYDTVLCLEMLEHDTAPFGTVAAAYGVLRPGGLFIATTRGIHYEIHDAPEDYFRFTIYGLALLMENALFTLIEVIEHPESKGVFGCGKA